MMLQNAHALCDAVSLYAVNNGYLFTCQDHDIIADCLVNTGACKERPVIENMNDNGIHFRQPLGNLEVIALPQMVNLLSGGVA